MKPHPAIIVLAVSVATIVFYSKNPALSSSNFRREFNEDSPPRSTSLKSISTSAANSSVVYGDHDSSLPGLHLCTCLNDAAAVDDTDAETPKRIRWLHFPKTGTSFISTLWSYACSTRERYIDLEISSFQCDIFAKNYFSMYDFALMRRYPWEMYGAPNLIRPDSKTLGKDTPLGLVGGTQHMAMTPPKQEVTPARHTKIKGLLNKINIWGSELDQNFTVAAFFRQPEQRIVSAFYDGRHTSGFTSELFSAVKNVSNGLPCKISGVTYKNPLECFARFPGVAGCMARMLSGEACADGLSQESGLENVPEAVDAIINRLKFIGITEEWNESVCQFHRLFAGKVGASGKRYWSPPLQGEFANVHTSGKVKRWGVRDLNGFKDVADGVIYEAAKLKYERMVGGKKCYRYMSYKELEQENERPEKLRERMPYLRTDQNGGLCRPKSCTDLQKQCGEWPDECGATVICGLCNAGRTGLPETWRVQCVEGKCVDYCPPWDEKGYWFKSDMIKPEAPKFIQQIASSLAEDESHLSPVLAVKVCQLACSTGSDMKKLADDGFCKCGQAPKTFLKKNLTAADFSEAHNLKTGCHEARANSVSLNENETQPICCPKIATAPLPQNWKKLNVMSMVASKTDNLEGEYFAHIFMGCGVFNECEKVAREQNAELAVFDRYNSMCYLARNVFELEDSYPVTKDNTHRFYVDLRS
ncbi:hypothetical protein ACHAW6_006612 [Cyclotella cf. meneghiniana]